MVKRIEKALAVLFSPGAVVEMRMLNTDRGTRSGYFDDMEKLAAEAERFSGRVPAVYVTLNQCRPDLLARARNRVRDYARETTGDDQILRRLWLPLDFDPVRPSGISATDAEHDAALARSIDCREWLRQRGWPEPVFADSGNGGHLLYRIDLPNEVEARELAQRVLKALAFRFDDAGVEVDQSTYNASRIWKLYGTLACKGDSVPERPHRLAELIDVPASMTVVSLEQLGAVAALLPEEPPRRQGAPTGEPFELDRWLRDHGLDAPSAGWQGGRKWVFEVCPWNSAHTDRSAYVVQFPSGAIAAGCHHNGCQQNHWHELRDRFEPGWRDRIPRNGSQPVAVVSDRPKFEGTFVANVAFVADCPEYQQPRELAPEALHGLAGEVVRTFEPHTESAPVALLGSFLVIMGNIFGRSPHYWIEGARHGTNLFLNLVGPTAGGRKGTGTRRIDELVLSSIGINYTKNIVRGLASGEGLIHHIRDARMEKVPVKKSGRFTGEYDEVIVDEGVDDKRMMVRQEEFVSVLKVAAREGNTLSDRLREAWDNVSMGSLTKGSRETTTDPHISIIGHITEADLRRYLTDTDAGNGFANRFLWVCTHRSKFLPRGGGQPNLAPLTYRVHEVIEIASRLEKFEFDDDAGDIWDTVYPTLSSGRPGLLGSVTSRAESQVLRLSVLYAALDGLRLIGVPHLMAALAFWEFCLSSCRYIFGDATGDEIADSIEDALRAVHPGFLTRTELRDHFGRHMPTARMQRALTLLVNEGRARMSKGDTGGRPEERWEFLLRTGRDKSDISDKSPLLLARSLLGQAATKAT